MLAPMARVENYPWAALPLVVNGPDQRSCGPWCGSTMDADPSARYFARRRNGIRLGHGDRRSASERTEAERDVRARLAARNVHRGHHSQCRAGVHDAADV